MGIGLIIGIIFFLIGALIYNHYQVSESLGYQVSESLGTIGMVIFIVGIILIITIILIMSLYKIFPKTIFYTIFS